MNEKMNEKEAHVELRIQDLLAACLRRWKIIAIFILIGATIAWGVTFFCMKPMYQASATLYVNNGDKIGVTSSDVSASIYLVKSYMVMASSDTLLEQVSENLGGEFTSQQLRSAVSTSQIDYTMIFTLHVSHKDPYAAERIANEMVKVLSEIGPEKIKGSNAQIIDTARVPTAPYSPSYTSNIFMGAAVGALLAVVLVVFLFLQDTRIKDENDLTDMFNLPILGRIPNFNDAVTGTRYAETDTDGGEGE